MTLRLLIFAVVSLGAGFGLGLAVLFARSCRASSAKWSDLITDDATGKTSGTKVGAIIGLCAVTIIFLRAGWNATPGDGLAMLILVYYGLATGSQFASKLVGARFGAAATPGVSTTSRTETVEETKTVALPVATVANPSSAVPPTERKS